MLAAEIFGEAGAVAMEGRLVQGGTGWRALREARMRMLLELGGRGRVGGKGGVGELVEA